MAEITAAQAARLLKFLRGKIDDQSHDAIADYIAGDGDLPENMEVRGAKVMSAMDHDIRGNPVPRARMSPSEEASYQRAFPNKIISVLK